MTETVPQKLHNLLMLDHTDQVLTRNREDLTHYRRNGASGYMAQQRESRPTEEDMRIVSSGDVHVHQSSPSPPQPTFSTLAKAGVMAALIASGAGAGIGIASLLLPDTPIATAPVDTNTTTTIERDYSIGEITVE